MPKFKLSLAMFIFGTIGLFVRYIHLPTSFIALTRGIIGALFLVIVLKGKFDKLAIKRYWKWLVASGVFIGVEWVLFFEALRQTSVSIATLCYYMAPVFFVLLSAFLLKNRITKGQIILLIIELFGMLLVTGVLEQQSTNNQLSGIILALLAAVLYALIVLCNQKMVHIRPIEKTAIQLVVAAIILLPYVCLRDIQNVNNVSVLEIVMLLVVGIIHTGYAYMIYFGSVAQLPSATVAILSYIDPIVAVILSAFLLNEAMSPLMWLGVVLIMLVTLGVEIIKVKRRDQDEISY